MSKHSSLLNDLSVYLTPDPQQKDKIKIKGYLNGKPIDKVLVKFLNYQTDQNLVTSIITTIVEDITLSQQLFSKLHNPDIKIKHNWGLTDSELTQVVDYLGIVKK